MHRTLRAAALAAALALAPAFSASALGVFPQGMYQAFDHGFGNLGPAYGLRVDDGAVDQVFSVEIGAASILLTWDLLSATLTGTLNANTAGGNGGPDGTWMVSYTLTGITVLPGNSGFEATAGTGTLTDPLNNVFNITGKADDSGKVFRCVADGHRLPGDDDSPVCRGWLEGGGTNDWLIKTGLEPIPEPGTVLLLGLGLAGLALQRRPR